MEQKIKEEVYVMNENIQPTFNDLRQHKFSSTNCTENKKL